MTTIKNSNFSIDANGNISIDLCVAGVRLLWFTADHPMGKKPTQWGWSELSLGKSKGVRFGGQYRKQAGRKQWISYR